MCYPSGRPGRGPDFTLLPCRACRGNWVGMFSNRIGGAFPDPISPSPLALSARARSKIRPSSRRPPVVFQVCIAPCLRSLRGGPPKSLSRLIGRLQLACGGAWHRLGELVSEFRRPQISASAAAFRGTAHFPERGRRLGAAGPSSTSVQVPPRSPAGLPAEPAHFAAILASRPQP